MSNKLWESHRMISPEAREMLTNECDNCCLFVTIQGPPRSARAVLPMSGSIGHYPSRVPAVIHVMELMRSDGKEGLARILAKGNSGAQACEIWLPKQK